MFDEFYEWFLTKPEKSLNRRKSKPGIYSDGDVNFSLYYNSAFELSNVDWHYYDGTIKKWRWVEIYHDRIEFTLNSITEKSFDKTIISTAFFSPEVTEEELFQSSLVQDEIPVSVEDFKKLLYISRTLHDEY